MSPQLLPPQSAFSLKSLLIPSAAIILTSGWLTNPASAQLTPNTASQGYQTNEINNFTGIDQGTFNPMDLIHRASMGPQRSLGEFQQDGKKKLDDAAAQFRRQQLELLQQQRLNNANPASSANPALPEVR